MLPLSDARNTDGAGDEPSRLIGGTGEDEVEGIGVWYPGGREVAEPEGSRVW